MGKAKRFNSYDQAVQDQRNIVQNYGQGRQGLSGIRSSFRTAPPSPISDFDPNREENIATVVADNLGNHTATQDLNLAGNDIILSSDGDTKFNVVGANVLFQCSNSGSSTEVFRIGATQLQMAQNIDLNTNDIQGVDTVFFNASGTNDATIDGSTAGLSHNVATGDVHTFQINSNTKLQITNTAINVYEDIDSDSGATFAGSVTINGAVALGNASTDLIFASGRFNTSLIPNTDNDVDLGSSTNEWRHLYVDGTANLDTVSAGATTTGTLFTTSTTSLGDADTDAINFYGMTDWKNNTTASNASTGNRDGYITIKINGTEKKLYYYA